MDDSDLARRFAAGGEAAFAAVHEAFRGPVFGIAMHALADRGLAEEASQMAFLRLWQARKRYDPERSLEAWLFSITRRAAIDIYRRERRLPVTTEIEERDVGVEALSVERLWEAWEVRRAVDALPADEAEVVRLAHFFQWSHSEIAEHLGVPLGTVKSRSYRAHKRLAKSMSHLYDEKIPAGGAR
jgi:RNA polymerase sigma-70 factor (ECF subfamily)